jgi:hypothetical protein
MDGGRSAVDFVDAGFFFRSFHYRGVEALEKRVERLARPSKKHRQASVAVVRGSDTADIAKRGHADGSAVVDQLGYGENSAS